MAKDQSVMTLQDAQNQVVIADAVTASQRVVLTQKTPEQVIKRRKGRGGMTLSYIQHGWVTATLNEALAGPGVGTCWIIRYWESQREKYWCWGG